MRTDELIDVCIAIYIVLKYTVGMENVRIRYGDGYLDVRAPHENLKNILTPNAVNPAVDAAGEIERALNNPVGCGPLNTAAGLNALILVDDNTRLTPAGEILPRMLDKLNAAGIDDKYITALVALGTHRPMTRDEMIVKYGNETYNRIRIINHDFKDPCLVDMGTTENGTPVSVNKLLLEHDIVVGVGSIVPHHIPGFSGGAKIVQPGVCGEETTAGTHLLSVRSGRSMLGRLENPVRNEMELIADKANVKYIFNAVHDSQGRLIKGFFGDIRLAFREGAALSKRVYGVKLREKTDIVAAGSYPCDLEFWQAHKTLYACEAAVKEGGTMIIITPCPEGVSATHGDIIDYADQSPEDIDAQIKNGTIKDKVAGALALAWSQIRKYADVYLVTGGIDERTVKKLGFKYFATPGEALAAAFSRHGNDAGVTVIPAAGDIYPYTEDGE